MSKNTRVPAVPLITNDPYFSAWSPSDALYESTVTHWAGEPNRMNGNILIDGKCYRFMGQAGAEETMKQTGLSVTPTSSRYRFEGGGIVLDVVFTSPLLLSDLTLVSRPCTYADIAVCSSDGKAHSVSVVWDMDESFCHNASEQKPMTGGVHKLNGRGCGWMGLKSQTPLGHSGDLIKINWGYLYLWGRETNFVEGIDALRNGRLGLAAPENAGASGLLVTVDFGEVTETKSDFLAIAYDDLFSIQYFGDVKKAYWADDGATILEAISGAVNGHDSILSRCQVFDAKLHDDAVKVAGEEYAAICALAYRQTVAAHKLILDNGGEVIFLSKECHSNGCIGTVDVSYPSMPLYLIYNPELVKGMIRPVLKFAKLPVWEYDFAPHDVGRYPYAWGQVYGRAGNDGGKNGARFDNGDIYPNYYIFPAGSGVYNLKYQMPVEECGNMLVMINAVIRHDYSAIREFEKDMPLLEKWAGYLIKYGEDPGEQLCTDDFAGHLARNVNLSVKAIMGVASLGLIKQAAGQDEEGGAYLFTAKQMAKRWEEKFAGMDHTPLTFADMDTWGLKYNMVWDKIFGLDLFSDETYRREIAYYKKMTNKYGVPLDNRKTYTKSDWILWCAAFAESKEDKAALIAPVYRFLCETEDRVPFSDWYDTADGKHYNFINRTVQGGLFMPLLCTENEANNN